MGPQPRPPRSPPRAAYYGRWAFALFVEEMYQWELDLRRNEAHCIEWVQVRGG
jgi:hypothetical protein